MLDRIITDIEAEGGTCYQVGGCVRDRLLGVAPKDIDVEVYAMKSDALISVLARYGKVSTVGAAFGVIKVRVGETEFDFSMPRRDSKSGAGHKGFIVETDSRMTLPEAAARRDFTINAISQDTQGNIHDPYNGAADLEQRILRHVSPAFAEDPLRVLRGMQFAARFDMSVAQETAALCRSLLPAYGTLSIERVWTEWQKWATKGRVPSRGLSFLYRTGWINLYPELAALIGLPQEPEWHPEGTRLSAISIDSSLARSAIPLPVDLNFVSFREFISCAATGNASIESGCGAPLTKIINQDVASRFPSAIGTGLDGTSFSGEFGEAGLAQAMSFVWKASFAARANEGRRIVLKIPFSRVKTIVDAGVDDFQVVWAVIRNVAVPVMNMLSPGKGASSHEHHYDPMNADGPVDSWPRCVEITARMDVDSGSSTVDRDVFFTFAIATIGDADRCVHTDNYTSRHNLFQFHNGGAYIHTKHVCDAAAAIAERDNLDEEDRTVLVFGALCHDFGKATTTAIINNRITSHGHDEAGVAPTESFMRSIGAPESIVNRVAQLTKHHMAHVNGTHTMNSARRLVARLGIHPDQLFRLIEADHSGRPPLPAGLPESAQTLMALIAQIGPTIVPILMGRHLLVHGWTPGPLMGQILRAVLEQQIDGAVSTFEQALAAAHTLRHEFVTIQ